MYACRSASELRASLDRAVRSKASLEAAVNALSRTQQQEEALAVEQAIAHAQGDASLLQVSGFTEKPLPIIVPELTLACRLVKAELAFFAGVHPTVQKQD